MNNIRVAGDNVTTLSYLEAPSDCQYTNSSSVMTSSVGDMGRYGHLPTDGVFQAILLVFPGACACAALVETKVAGKFSQSQ